MKFNILAIDPPYGFSDKLQMSDVKRGAQANYNTMTIQEIAAMDIKSITSDNGALLALWVPSSLLQEGLDIMKAWGFTHKQTYVWVKIKKEPFLGFSKWIVKSILKHPQVVYDNFAYKRAINSIVDSLKNLSLNDCRCFGMGRLFRQTHEICLIGISAIDIYKILNNKSQRSVSMAENLKHSAKPEDLQDSLDLMFPNTTKLEMFARRIRPGWECIGNEVCNGEDINVSISNL